MHFMQKIFNVSRNFSYHLDEIRGPNRKKMSLKTLQAWMNPSSARRTLAKGLGYSALGLFAGTIIVIVFKKQRSLNISSHLRQSYPNQLAG